MHGGECRGVAASYSVGVGGRCWGGVPCFAGGDGGSCCGDATSCSVGVDVVVAVNGDVESGGSCPSPLNSEEVHDSLVPKECSLPARCCETVLAGGDTAVVVAAPVLQGRRRSRAGCCVVA